MRQTAQHAAFRSNYLEVSGAWFSLIGHRLTWDPLQTEVPMCRQVDRKWCMSGQNKSIDRGAKIHQIVMVFQRLHVQKSQKQDSTLSPISDTLSKRSFGVSFSSISLKTDVQLRANGRKTVYCSKVLRDSPRKSYRANLEV